MNNNDLDPFDDIQCEELIPEHWEGSPEPEPLTEAQLEQQWHDWKRENPERAKILEEIEALFGLERFK